MQSKKYLLSVIICSYNTKELTLRCIDKLESSIKFLGKPVEVIIVENGNDGTDNAVGKKYPWVKLLRQKENTGFAKGNNIGISAASKDSKYILLLNTDVLVETETLKKSFEFLENNTDCDVLGCRLNFVGGRLQPSAGFLPTPVSIFTWITGADLLPFIGRLFLQFHPKFKKFFEKNRQVGWVMGAYFFARREVFDNTGGFDLNFFMYLEEVELCRRIKELGMKICYIPEFSVTHLDKASSGGNLRKPTIMEISGIVYFLKKYHKNAIWWLLPVIKTAVFIRMLVFRAIGNKYRSDIYKEVFGLVSLR